MFYMAYKGSHLISISHSFFKTFQRSSISMFSGIISVIQVLEKKPFTVPQCAELTYGLLKMCDALTLNKLGGGKFDSLLCFFHKCIFYNEDKSFKSFFLMTFNIIISHIFPKNFIEIPQVVQKILRFSLSILTFSSIFQFFDISLYQRN